ncbi:MULTISPECIES: cytochrome bc complex cytochrome b subunit [Haloferacaceae]|uniref:Cytochrome bc complex cytochrome b subunit n=1 Tax=Halorubrum glutamatedens TaxID=2707018 RepID=A0ABD5QR91_9EURY|nr:cytochrome bc complex cytochrome b subunit [Halobellus captivus]
MTDDNDPMTDGGTDEEARTDGGPPATVPPDDETPTWSERKENSQGLAQLTYQYFERSRREDEDLRTESTYVERDVLGFPAWPHETIRNLAIASFFVGMLIFISALMPPHFGHPANPGSTPAIILPDWYLYWSFGLLKLNPLNPELAVLDGNILLGNEFLGIIAHGIVFGAIALVPFLNKGSARRPVEEPFWAAVGVTGVVLSLTLAALAIQNFFPFELDLLVTLTFLLPVLCGIITYAVLKTMREGYMYDLNRRYYMLRPPK